MSSLLTLSNLAIVLLILSGAVFLFARTYQQQLIGTARTNSLRTVTQVSPGQQHRQRLSRGNQRRDAHPGGGNDRRGKAADRLL